MDDFTWHPWNPGSSVEPFTALCTRTGSALTAAQLHVLVSPQIPVLPPAQHPPALALLGGSRMEPQLELPGCVPGASCGKQWLQSHFPASCTHDRNTFSSTNSLILQQGQDDKSDYINVRSFTQLFGIYKFTICFNGRTTCLFLGNYCFTFNGFSPSMRAAPRTLSSQLLYIHGQQPSWQNPELWAQWMSGRS